LSVIDISILKFDSTSPQISAFRQSHAARFPIRAIEKWCGFLITPVVQEFCTVMR
jgi:hypothetical protein